MTLLCDIVQAAYPIIHKLFNIYLRLPSPDLAPESASRMSRYYYYATQLCSSMPFHSSSQYEGPRKKAGQCHVDGGD